MTLPSFSKYIEETAHMNAKVKFMGDVKYIENTVHSVFGWASRSHADETLCNDIKAALEKYREHAISVNMNNDYYKLIKKIEG